MIKNLTNNEAHIEAEKDTFNYLKDELNHRTKIVEYFSKKENYCEDEKNFIERYKFDIECIIDILNGNEKEDNPWVRYRNGNYGLAKSVFDIQFNAGCKFECECENCTCEN